MKFVSFLLDTLWVGYALFFRPAALAARLRLALPGKAERGKVTQLGVVIANLHQIAARRYLVQIALLCAIAASPILILAPLAPSPPSLTVLIVTWLLICFVGIGYAFWDPGLGLGGAITMALLAGSQVVPGKWLTVAASAEVLDLLWHEVVPGILVGASAGFVAAGSIALQRYKRAAGFSSNDNNLAVVYGMAFGVAGVVAIVVVSVVAGALAGAVAGLVTIVVAIYAVNIREDGGATSNVDDVAFGVALEVTFGVAFGVTFGMAFGVAFGVASVVAGGAAVGVASVVAGGAAFGVAFVVAGVVVFGVAGGLDGVLSFVLAGAVAGIVAVIVVTVAAIVAAMASVAGGVAGVVAVSVAELPSVSPLLLMASAIMLGGALGSRRWGRQFALFSAGFLASIGLALLPAAPEKAVLWLVAGMVGFLRLPSYGLEAMGATFAYVRRRLFAGRQGEMNPAPFPAIWRYDELIPLPLPFLDRLLAQAVQQDRRTGLALIEEVAGTWRQGIMAQRALVQVAAAELARRDDEASIAAVGRDLAWLPGVPSPTAQGTLARFRTIGALLAEKRTLTDSEAQLAQLSRTTAALDEMIQGLTFVPGSERELFLPVAQQWRAVLRRATTRLPNPYVAGDPLRGEQPLLFVGREDLVRALQVHLRDRSQRPTLVLFGQRRMGKSSLLYQLPHQFDAETVPVRVDCQAAEMQESNTAFFFNVARAIYRQSLEHRAIEFAAPPPLSEMSATAFSQWLERVETQLGSRVLLLCLDEFERIGEAVNRGWLDERVLDFLRNLIQHHPQVTLLLAGSHRPAEIGRPWSDYLISATVLPISYLQPRDVEKLVTQPIPGFPLHYAPEAVQHIIDLTRCQPLLVQLLCQQLVILLNERGEREAGVAEVDAAVPGALAQGGSLYFTYLAEYDAGTAGQTMLVELAHRGPGAVMPEAILTQGRSDRQTALRRLLARDLIERVDGGIHFQVELTRRWWAEYGTASPDG